MLSTEELDDLLEEIQHRIIAANRRGTLGDLLERMGMADLLKPATPRFESYREGKIVVIGGSTVTEEKLRTVLGKSGVDRNRLECCLDYEAAKSYNYKKLQYAAKYRVVLFGPVPHKTEGTGESGSVIAALENGEGYPRVVRLDSNGELKITETSFKKAISKLKAEGYI